MDDLAFFCSNKIFVEFSLVSPSSLKGEGEDKGALIMVLSELSWRVDYRVFVIILLVELVRKNVL